MYKTKKGYIKIQCQNHPRADKNGSVYEHVLIMEKHLGRHLIPNVDDIHHINGDKTDNRIENLELISHSQHLTRHKNKIRIDMTDRICSRCNSFDTRYQRQKIGLRPIWLYDKTTGLLICTRCDSKIRRSSQKLRAQKP